MLKLRILPCTWRDVLMMGLLTIGFLAFLTLQDSASSPALTGHPRQLRQRARLARPSRSHAGAASVSSSGDSNSNSNNNIDDDEDEDDSVRTSDRSPGTPLSGKATTVKCTGKPNFNQTCIFRNVLLSPRRDVRLHLLVVGDTFVPSMGFSKWGGPSPQDQRVLLHRFEDSEQLEAFVSERSPQRQAGLSVIFSQYYQNNWAHAIWDALYPVHVALAKFGKHRESFVPYIYTKERNPSRNCSIPVAENESMACAMEEAYRLFAATSQARTARTKEEESHSSPQGSGPSLENRLESSELKYVPRVGEWLFFDELVMGCGHAGQYASVLTLPFHDKGPDRENLVDSFVHRLFQAYDLTPPTARTHSSELRAPGAKLKAVITKNKRFDESTTAVLENAARTLNRNLPGVEVQLVDWGSIRPFHKQLEYVRDVDIHVSSIGTAMFFSLLLPDGSVTINLGHVLQRQANAFLPDFGEEFIGTSRSLSRTLFAPLTELNSGLSTGGVVALVQQAVDLINNDFSTKDYGIDDNLSIFGRFFRSYMAKNSSVQAAVQGFDANGTWSFRNNIHCPNRFISSLVLESPTEHFSKCGLNLKELRSFKQHWRLGEKLGITPVSHPQCSECAVCEACFPSSAAAAAAAAAATLPA